MKKKNLFGLLLSVAMLASCNSKNPESSSQPSSVTSSSSTSVESSSSSNSVESSSSSKVEEKVTVTFDADNGVLTGSASLSVKKGEKIDQSQIPTASKDKHAFRFWAKRGETTAFDFNTVITDNLELIAIYQADTFTITYEGLKDSETHNNRTSYSSDTPTFTLQKPAFNREGYEFDSWLDEEGRPISSVNQGSTGNRRFTASFKVINYTITYKGLEGTTNSNSNPTSYTIETDTITLQDPGERNGYKFTGWEDSDNQKVTEITKGSTGDKVFTATWRHYTITYIISDGDIKGADWKGDKLEYTENDVITLPTVSNPNLTFKGWKIRSNGGAAAKKIYSGKIPASTFTGDIELVPYYVATVIFKTDAQSLDIKNVLGDKVLYNEKGKFYYLEFEIGETLKNLPMSSVTGEDKFEKMWYVEQGKRVDIEIIEETKDDKTVRYPNFKVTKNITLWVWEATGGPGMS